jgi:hypothetical protein
MFIVFVLNTQVRFQYKVDIPNFCRILGEMENSMRVADTSFRLAHCGCYHRWLSDGSDFNGCALSSYTSHPIYRVWRSERVHLAFADVALLLQLLSRPV